MGWHGLAMVGLCSLFVVVFHYNSCYPDKFWYSVFWSRDLFLLLCAATLLAGLFDHLGCKRFGSVHLATHLIPGRRLVTRLFKSYEEPRLQIEQSEEAKRSEAKCSEVQQH